MANNPRLYFGLLMQLTNVDIERNGLTGTLPSSWSTLASVRDFDWNHA